VCGRTAPTTPPSSPRTNSTNTTHTRRPVPHPLFPSHHALSSTRHTNHLRPQAADTQPLPSGAPAQTSHGRAHAHALHFHSHQSSPAAKQVHSRSFLGIPRGRDEGPRCSCRSLRTPHGPENSCGDTSCVQRVIPHPDPIPSPESPGQPWAFRETTEHNCSSVPCEPNGSGQTRDNPRDRQSCCTLLLCSSAALIVCASTHRTVSHVRCEPGAANQCRLHQTRSTPRAYVDGNREPRQNPTVIPITSECASNA
jgi:hypothetical protein